MYKIAVIGPPKLGDSILVLYFSQQLTKFHDFEVTFFSNVLYQLKDFIPYPKMEKAKSIETLDQIGLEFDLILVMNIEIAVDFAQRVSPNIKKEKFSFIIKLSKIEEADTVALLKPFFSSRNEFTHPILHRLKSFSTKTDLFVPLVPVVDHVRKILLTEIGLPQIDKEIAYNLDEKLIKKTTRYDVLIGPTSAESRKNFSFKKLKKVAAKIRKRGLSVAFVFSPSEYESLKDFFHGEECVPCSILELFCLLTRSSYFIGPDSGTGHLASSLGKPVLTLFLRSSSHALRWLPGFHKAYFVTPTFITLFKRTHYRASFISARRVFKEFERMVEESKK